jgi:hypothetical protein
MSKPNGFPSSSPLLVRPPSRLISLERLPRLLRLVGVHRYDLYTWYTSWCLPQAYLFAFRSFCALYLVMALGLGFSYGSHAQTVQFFFFFTYISTFLLACYFLLHAWHTLRVFHFASAYFQRQATRASPYYLWLLQFLYSGCFVFHVIVIAIYWSILYPSIQRKLLRLGLVLTPVARWLDVSVHILPMCFLLVEIAVNNRFHVYAVEIFQTVIFMLGYMLWMWLGALVYYVVTKQAWWVYPHFNFVDRANSIYYYFCIVGLTIFGFFAMYALHRVKLYFSGCMPLPGEQDDNHVECPFPTKQSMQTLSIHLDTEVI